MLKKIMKKIKQLSQGSSERRHGHYRRGSSSSSRGYKRYPISGSDRYKRKGRGSSS
ncbi:hypothetical protein P9443_16655 [Peribacillus frigoritolerans]|uniref:hypothetical protein n=1 Tax=Peribacillus frigoritolerans TaxID=450367 RepID=UPI0022808D31|nr:hypothetical protein [Peribacillus frigoritolerans]MCY9006116.1 hypothetical protein [Peribacillus frigoritolerans]MED4634509.1 hypothetical protein [Peribacillus frigoritolerans]